MKIVFVLVLMVLIGCKNSDKDSNIEMRTISTSFDDKVLNNRNSHTKRFNIEKDLLLVQFDCKTDVDDLHSIAALATLLTDTTYSKLKYHAVAGTYGIQDGLYVPPNTLFQLVFDDNWTDAHDDVISAIEKVKVKVKSTLLGKGDIWIAEAGQSDFTARIVKAIQLGLPKVNTLQRIHVVQHSDWNEQTTTPKSLDFVKTNSNYHKIADGNFVGNGTPGFQDAEYTDWKGKIDNPQVIKIWQHTIDLSNTYNGKDGRYNNKAVAAGGLDFSDLSEVCWILDIQDIKDVDDFFKLYSN
ncbi:hypothetical protein [Winogradskyella flava]|uniref:Uncharacterized protein n=1 Tax=Winogradskyella flava TaxID=1884876 RepID=A0A842ISX0_9FLAO|nr:hypothetical protein [Winogradskyella flava]MBC2846262.1 hypothetical protein [Winogradskyella flava]